MMNGIYDYFAEIYATQGIDAMEVEQQKVWKLYNEDEQAFDAYIAAHGIDLMAQTIGLTELDFKLWCWDMEG